jgi:hypothetical protein
MNQQMAYFNGLPESKQEAMRTEIQQANYVKQALEMIDAQYKGSNLLPNMEQSPVIQTPADTQNR